MFNCDTALNIRCCKRSIFQSVLSCYNEWLLSCLLKYLSVAHNLQKLRSLIVHIFKSIDIATLLYFAYSGVENIANEITIMGSCYEHCLLLLLKKGCECFFSYSKSYILICFTTTYMYVYHISSVPNLVLSFSSI